jgi:Skp family chaperone for outer membrane proteins
MLRRILHATLGLTLLFAPAAAIAQEETLRIGVFDPELIWRQTEVGKKYNADLSAARDRLQADIDKKQVDLEGLRDQLRQQQASLNERRIQQMQKDILDKKTDLDRLNEDATREMRSQLADIQTRFQEMLIRTLDVFGEESTYTLILNKGVIDYNSTSIDITEKLIARFDQMHKVPPTSASNAP